MIFVLLNAREYMGVHCYYCEFSSFLLSNILIELKIRLLLLQCLSTVVTFPMLLILDACVLFRLNTKERMRNLVCEIAMDEWMTDTSEREVF